MRDTQGYWNSRQRWCRLIFLSIGLLLGGCETLKPGNRPESGTKVAKTERHAFIVSGDPQYLAEKSLEPRKLDPYSEEANSRFVKIIKQLPGTRIPEKMGGGSVSKDILGMIVTGDLIDSADKSGGPYPAMQEFEWARFLKDYGLKGGDGKVRYPVYELHGNHDGPQGDTFIIEEIIRRNPRRPQIRNISSNGLHYSWDWGPLHLVNLGMFAGEGEKRREGHHYSPRASLEFLKDDLKQCVGDSGKPIILSFHLHPFGPEYDWPKEDLNAFWNTLSRYKVVALFHGHTHGSPPSRNRWDGKAFGGRLETGLDIFNPDDSGAAKTDKRNPGKGVGINHGFLYVEFLDHPGAKPDQLVIRSYATRDNWATHDWHSSWTRDFQNKDL